MENFPSCFQDLEDPRPGNAGLHDLLEILRAGHDTVWRQIGGRYGPLRPVEGRASAAVPQQGRKCKLF